MNGITKTIILVLIAVLFTMCSQDTYPTEGERAINKYNKISEYSKLNYAFFYKYRIWDSMEFVDAVNYKLYYHPYGKDIDIIELNIHDACFFIGSTNKGMSNYGENLKRELNIVFEKYKKMKGKK